MFRNCFQRLSTQAPVFSPHNDLIAGLNTQSDALSFWDGELPLTAHGHRRGFHCRIIIAQTPVFTSPGNIDLPTHLRRTPGRVAAFRREYPENSSSEEITDRVPETAVLIRQLGCTQVRQ